MPCTTGRGEYTCTGSKIHLVDRFFLSITKMGPDLCAMGEVRLNRDEVKGERAEESFLLIRRGSHPGW